MLRSSDWSIPESLAGQSAVITGSSSGLGFELAKQLSERGAHVVVSGRGLQKTKLAADAVQAYATKRGVNGVNGRATPIIVDTSNFTDVRRFAADVLSVMDQVHMLVLNAASNYGWTRDEKIDKMKDEDFVSLSGHDKLMASNYLGHFLLFQLLASRLAPGGNIVVVSSTAQWSGETYRLYPDRVPWEKYRQYAQVAYADAKLAGVCFARALRRRKLAPSGQPVETILFVPGNIDSGMGLPKDTKGPLGINRDNQLWGWHAPAVHEAAHLLQALFVHQPPDALYSFFFPQWLFLTSTMENRLPVASQRRYSGYLVFLERLTYALHSSAAPNCNETVQEMLWTKSAMGVGFKVGDVPVP